VSEAPDESSRLLGILGAGQLGLMLAEAARSLGVRTRLLDPNPDSCAGQVSELIVAEYDDTDALARLIEGASAVTYEFENIPVPPVRTLAERHTVAPPPGALEMAQDRLNERKLFQRLGIAAPKSVAVDDLIDLAHALERVGTPALLKARRFGYDGKGQHPISDSGDAPIAWEAIGRSPGIVDAQVPFVRELSLVCVRSRTGQTGFYPLVENVHRGGILRLTRAPAQGITPALDAAARRAGEAILEELDYVGVLAVEFFQMGAGDDATLLANEIAPRVHNSGHWTIEGAETSQFENHVRAVMGMAIGSCDAIGHSAMINLVGSVPSPERIASIPGAVLHDYAKQPRPRRKVGHVTITADDRGELDALLERFTRVVA